MFDERSILSLVGSTGKHSPPSLRRISIPSLRPPLIPTHVSNSNELVLPIESEYVLLQHVLPPSVLLQQQPKAT